MSLLSSLLENEFFVVGPGEVKKIPKIELNKVEEIDLTAEPEEKCRDFFLKGRCWRGSACKFAHGRQCIDFSNGKCHRSDCKFAHIQPSDQSGGSQDEDREICLDFQKGKCFRGAACRFLHESYGPTKCHDFSVGRGGGINFFSGAASQAQLLFGTDPFRTEARKPACRDFQNGRCTRGASCRFSHGSPPLGPLQTRAPLPLALSPALTLPSQTNYLAVLEPLLRMSNLQACFQTQTALPNPALNPALALGVQALAERLAASVQNPALPLLWAAAPQAFELPELRSFTEPLIPCRDFQKGMCTRGASCRFSHDMLSLPHKEMEICRDHLKGSCTRGASCKFLHSLSPQPDITSLLEENPRRRSNEPCRDYLNGNCHRGASCRFSHTTSDPRASTRYSPY